MYIEIRDDIDILKDVKMISFLALSFATLEKVDLALCHHLGGAVDGQTSDVVWGPQFPSGWWSWFTQADREDSVAFALKAAKS